MNDVATPTAAEGRVARPRARWLAGAVLLVLCGGLLQTCALPPPRLEQVRQSGVLRVAMVNGPTTYFVGPAGPTGFEYDLAKSLADRLGVVLEVRLATNAPQALERVKSGQVDFAAAGIGVTESRALEVRFTQPLVTVVPRLIHAAGRATPASLDQLDGELVVVAGSAHADRLKTLRNTHPNLVWREVADLEPEELLRQVAEGEIAYTIANSDLVAINQRYYPNLRVGFPIAESQALAWAFPRRSDETLVGAAKDFLHDLGEIELARLQDRYLGHVEQVDYLGAVALATHYGSRLPRYRDTFAEAAERFGFDWRLLAAIAYQESHWDPGATSPTGVQGLMQLTLDTASFVNVVNREDPMQSIWGGTRYFRWLLDQLPKTIAEPDRTWLGLAAYNMGLGHLLDAMDLTAKRGGDPTRWLDVRNNLPLLTQSKWHAQTRYGYARGYQAMHYVGNVRTYYDMLLWMSDEPSAAPAALMETADSPVPRTEPVASKRDPLEIDSPVL